MGNAARWIFTVALMTWILFDVLPGMASQINGTVGQSVLLPCLLPSPPHSLNNTRVYWQTEKANGKDKAVLHFVNNSVEVLIHQAHQYRNRTALDLSQVASGNFSLLLKNLTVEDNQTNIQCLFRDSRDVLAQEVNRITLLVLKGRPDIYVLPGMASQINSTVGQSVLLPCLLPSPPHSLNNTRVYWQTEKANGKDKAVLHFVNNSVEVLIHQAHQYRNRTALDLSQLASGNFSLLLKNLTVEDNQTNIQCLFRDSRDVSAQEVNRITLLVLKGRPDIFPLIMASQINATVGQSVLLPCLLPSPPPRLKNTWVYWQTEEGNGRDQAVVHLVNMGKEDFVHQAHQYRNRTALDLSQLASGNFSLLLKNLTAHDNQTTFQCLSRGSRGVSPRIVYRITLLVLERKPDIKVPELQSFPGWVIVLLVVALLLLVCLVLYKV